MKKQKQILVFGILLGILIISVILVLASETQLFYDDVESWGDDTNCGGGTTPWDVCDICSGTSNGDLTRHTSEYEGTYAMEADDFDGDCEALKQTLDLRDYESINISFCFTAYGVDAGEYARLYFNDGSSNLIKEINSTHNQLDATPDPEDYVCVEFALDNSTYNFQQYNNVTWNFNMDGASDLIFIDAFEVKGIQPDAPVDVCNYSGSGNWEVSHNCNYTNQDFVIDGNLSITSGGTMNLINTTLTFNSSNQWIIFDNVADENKMILNGTSRIN